MDPPPHLARTGPHRDRYKEILEMLEKAGINGWAVLVERLQLEKDDSGWERFSHKAGTLPYDKHNGVSPLRMVWRRTGDCELHPFLDRVPRERGMALSQPIRKIPKGY